MRPSAVVVLLCFALAGCSGGGDDADGTSSGPGGGSSTGPGASSLPPGSSQQSVNHPPRGTLTPNATTGVAPLAVRFVLDGSDPDGDALSWRLAVEGQEPASGTTLPATVDRTFAAGSWVVELTLDDGTDIGGMQVTLLVAPANEPAVEFSGTVKGIDPTANATLAATAGGCKLGDPATPGGPVGGGWHDLPPEAADRDYVVAPAGKGFVAQFMKSDGAAAGLGGESGIVPLDAAQVRICTADPTAGTTYTFTAVPAFRVSSTAFPHGGKIPVTYTCDGGDHQPPLAFKRLPAGTQQLAMIVEDPDAPGGMFIHWAWWNLPAAVETLAEDDAMTGATEGENDFGSDGWAGPCPPPGTSHHYHFRLFALSGPVQLTAGSTAAQLRTAMQGLALGETVLTGLYP